MYRQPEERHRTVQPVERFRMKQNQKERSQTLTGIAGNADKDRTEGDPNSEGERNKETKSATTARCPARSATCNFCRKIGQHAKTCKGKHGNRGPPAVGQIQGQEEQHMSESGDMEVIQSRLESSVGWVKKPEE